MQNTHNLKDFFRLSNNIFLLDINTIKGTKVELIIRERFITLWNNQQLIFFCKIGPVF